MQPATPAQHDWQALNEAITHHQADVHPLTATLAVNYRCNSKCTYCYIWQHHVENTLLAELRRAIDQLARLGVPLISLTGGEPFLHPDLPEIVAAVRASGRVCSITTNGLLLRPAAVRGVADAGLNSLVISLDTIDPALYQRIRGVPLRKVLQGLNVALAERERAPALRVSINCVLSRANLHAVVELVEFCRRADVSIGFQPLHPAFASGRQEIPDLLFEPGDRDELQRLIDRLVEMQARGYRITSPKAYLAGFADYLVARKLPDGFRCNAGFVTIALDHQLNVRSCWSMPPLAGRGVDLVELWHSDAYRERRGQMLALQCPGCWLRCHTEERSSDWIDSLFKEAATSEWEHE
jgi:MoaA/NifB/PqqE/SkfB family radical SAM enzyme